MIRQRLRPPCAIAALSILTLIGNPGAPVGVRQAEAGDAAALCAYVTHPHADGVSVLDVGRREWVGMIPLSGPIDVALRPDGLRAYVTRNADVGPNGSVAVIDTQSGTVCDVLRITRGEPVGIAASPNGAFALVALWSDENLLARIDTAAETLTDLLPLEGEPPRRQERAFSVAISPDGTLAHVAIHFAHGVLRNQIVAIDPTGGLVAAALEFPTQPRHVAFAPDGQSVYATVHGATADDPAAVLVIDPTTQSVTSRVEFPYGAEFVAPSRDGATLYVSHPFRDRVSVIDTGSNDLRLEIASASFPGALAVAPDGSVVLVANFLSRSVGVIDPAANAIVDTIDVPFEPENLAVGSVPGGCVAPPLPPTATPPASPTPTAPPTCGGDCDGDGAVTIDELLRAVAIASGGVVIDRCRAADIDASNVVTIDELVGATRNALVGCARS
jgi:YVTN family beta-propeller protein